MGVNHYQTWLKLHNSVEREIENWSKVHLSLRGRIAVSKNILYGRLWYATKLVPWNVEIAKEIERATYLSIYMGDKGPSGASYLAAR